MFVETGGGEGGSIKPIRRTAKPYDPYQQYHRRIGRQTTSQAKMTKEELFRSNFDRWRYSGDKLALLRYNSSFNKIKGPKVVEEVPFWKTEEFKNETIAVLLDSIGFGAKIAARNQNPYLKAAGIAGQIGVNSGRRYNQRRTKRTYPSSAGKYRTNTKRTYGYRSNYRKYPKGD